MIAKFRRAENPLVAGGFALGVGSYAVCAAQVNVFGAVKIVRRFLPGEFHHYIEPLAKVVDSRKVEGAFGEMSLGVSRVGDAFGRRRIRCQSAGCKPRIVGQSVFLAAHNAVRADVKGMAVFFPRKIIAGEFVLNIAVIVPIYQRKTVCVSIPKGCAPIYAVSVCIALCAKSAKHVAEFIIGTGKTYARFCRAVADGHLVAYVVVVLPLVGKKKTEVDFFPAAQCVV